MRLTVLTQACLGLPLSAVVVAVKLVPALVRSVDLVVVMVPVVLKLLMARLVRLVRVTLAATTGSKLMGSPVVAVAARAR
jgi:hypothetical protein